MYRVLVLFTSSMLNIKIKIRMKLLINRHQIGQEVYRIGKQISALELDDLVLLFVLKGSMYFGINLSKDILTSHEVHTIDMKSYVGTENGKITVSGIPTKKDLMNKNVIVIEDIIDTSHTLTFLLKMIKEEYNVKSVRVASLLHKKSKSKLQKNIQYFIGFEIEDQFVVGYGLDCNQKNRDKPDIWVL